MSINKKIILTCFLILQVVVCFSLGLDLDLKQTSNGDSLVLKSQTDNTKFLISTTLDKTGNLSIKTPQFFSVELYPFLKVGELKPSGIIKQMLEPSDLSSNAKGFEEKSFKTVSTPSIKPKYSGLALNLGNINLFSFENRSFGFDAGFKRAFVSALVSSEKSQNTQDSFFVNWKNLDSRNIRFITGSNSEAKLGSFWLNSEVFITGKWDEKGGKTLGTGIDLKASSKGFLMEFRKRINIEQEATYIKLRNSFSEITYHDKIFPKSVFKGKDNKRNINLKTDFFIKGLKLSNDAAFSHMESGKEKRENTYSVSYSCKEITTKFKDSDGVCQLEFDCPNAKILINDGKTEIEYFWSFSLSDNVNGKLRINQDRELTLSLHFRS